MVVVGGGPTGVETAGAMAELYNGVFREGLSRTSSPEQARLVLVEASPEIFAMFKEDIRAYTDEGAREARRRGDDRRGRRVDHAGAGHAQVGNRALRAHARLGRRPAGERARPLARARARAGQPHRRRRGAAARRRTPRCSPSATSRRSPTRRRSRFCRSSARSRCSRASTPARRSPGSSPARRRSRSSTSDKGTMATIGRGAAVVQMLGGRTMKGKTAQLAWGTVHLALLPDERGPRQGGGRLGRARA